MARTRRVLAPSGTLISNGGGHAGGKLSRTLRTMLVSLFVRQQASPTLKTHNHDDLVELKELVEAGRITPVIDGVYPLSEVPGAMARVATGHARGTIVITVSGSGAASSLVTADRFAAAESAAAIAAAS